MVMEILFVVLLHIQLVPHTTDYKLIQMEQTVLNITSVGGCFKISVLVTKCEMGKVFLFLLGRQVGG